MQTTPRFLQGVYPFAGAGLDAPAPIGTGLTYTVPADRRAQLIYLRAGNASDDLVNLVLLRDGKPMRLFPVGAKSDSHVALSVVEDIEPDTKLELLLAAPIGVSAMVVIDVGLLEI